MGDKKEGREGEVQTGDMRKKEGTGKRGAGDKRG
jgi:hypothetical protein